MIKKTPDQDLYDLAAVTLQDLGYTIYTHSPDKARYPYVKLGTVELMTEPTKSWLIGKAYMDLDFWGLDRNELTQMVSGFLSEISQHKILPSGLNLHMRHDRTRLNIMPDNSTNDALWRARVQVEFEIE